MAQAGTKDLAPPGAGLPSFELFIARRLFRWKRRFWSRDRVEREFRDERREIRQWIDGCPQDDRGKRVLIRRLPGLEDSSRDWSLWMTLDHLRICNRVFAGVMKGLVEDRAPDRAASTADVKPSPDVGPEVDDAYEKACDDFLATVADLSDLATRTRYAHPWFGPLDAAGWHLLAAVHMGIHRRQIESIRLGVEPRVAQ